MATLLLDRANLEVRCDGDALALYEAGERRGSVPTKLLDRCIIYGSATRMDSGVLLKLAEAGVATVLFSPRMGRRVAIVLGPAHSDAGIRLAQARCVLDDAACRSWARDLVHAKLRRQRRVLQAWLTVRADVRKPLTDALATIDQALQSLAASVDGELALPALRGIEGAAARAHFAGLAAVVPPALGFVGRNRRPPRDPVNALLSLGYTLLHVQAVQACQAAGLDPLLGFYHRPAFGRESLASDLIEPLRAEIDQWVWQLLRDRTVRADHFRNDRGACLLGKAGRAAFYAAWAHDARAWQRWLRLATARLAGQLRTDGEILLAGPGDDDVEECA